MKLEGESDSCVDNVLCVLDLRRISVGGPVGAAVVGVPVVGAAVVGAPVGAAVVGADVGAARQAWHHASRIRCVVEARSVMLGPFL